MRAALLFSERERRAFTAVFLGALLLLLVACADDAEATVSGGTQRWSASYKYGGPAFAFAVGVTPDGATVFVSGTTVYGSSKPSDAATLAYDASTGAEKWVDVYASTSDSDQRDRATRLVVSPDGSKVFVTGNSTCHDCTGSAFVGYSTIAYDTDTGNRVWVAKYATDGGPYSIAVSPDGSELFVNGQSGWGEASATVAYDTSTGDRRWAIESSDEPVYWRALDASPDSSTVFAVSMSTSFGRGYHTTAYDASDGTEKWSAVNSAGIPTALAVSPDGSKVFVTGYGGASCCSSVVTTVAYDASTGNQLWAIQDDQIRVLNGDTTVHLRVSPDGSTVFVAGYYCDVYPCHDMPFATAAYAAGSGDRLWLSKYRSGGRNYLNDLAVSPDGSTVFVTGEEQLPCYSPCTTSQVNAPLIAYDATTGIERWVTDYDENLGQALAVSPDSSTVFLGGTFTASSATAARTSRQPRAASGCSSQCGYSTAAYNRGPGPGKSEDTAASPRYNGWRTFFDKTAFGGSYRASPARGATASYTTRKAGSLFWLTHRGPNQGRAKIFIDGHSRGTFDLYSPTTSARSVAFRGLPRTPHVVKVKVLGTKRASSKGTWVALDGFEVKRNLTRESSLGVQYDTWVGVFGSSASGGSYRKSLTPQARVTLDFRGRKIAWVTATGPSYGRAKVTIDGKAHTIDLYRSKHHWRVPIWFTGLSHGTHHIKVKPLGKKAAGSSSAEVVFDAFVVRT
jgi:hypothetical protein